MIGDKLLNIQRTYRGISVITPLPLGEGTGEGPLGGVASWGV